jgi:hypothetical protein
MDAIFSGLASMPRSETMNPRSMPRGTPKTHFSGVELHALCSQTLEYRFKVREKVRGFPRLDYDVIDVSLDRSANVLYEHVVHAPLVCRTCIPQLASWSDSFILIW